MFTYNIHRDTSDKKFVDACRKIEKHFQNIQKDNILVDVDGTLIQVYRIEGKKVKVLNDYEVGAVYAESEVDLSDIL